MNEELLNLNGILDIDNPVDLPKSTRPWVVDCLKEIGWNEDDKVPGNLPNYFASVFKVLDLPKSPDSIKEALEYPEVRMTLETAIKSVYTKEHASKIAEEKYMDFVGDSDANNPLIKQIYEEAVKAETKKIQEEPKKEVVETEDFTDLEQPEPETEETVFSGNYTQLPICPCCKWDLTKPYESPEITDEERRSYLLYVMGGPAFTKTYSLWGGACSVVFKATKNHEEDLFTELYAKDLREGRLETALIAQKKFNQYHLALSLSKLIYNTSVGIPSPVVPSVWSTDFDPADGKLRLQNFMEKWYLNTIESVEMENALIVEWRKFNDLLVQLQQELYRRDFWTGATSG